MSNKVQEALSLFSELQAVPFVDIDDDSRAANATSSAIQRPPPKRGPLGSNVKQSQLVGDLRSEIETLKKQNTISNAIIKKLHKRNKELESKLESKPVSSHSIENFSKSQMEDVIRDNDREIDALRKQAFQRPLSPVGKQSTQLSSTTLLHQRIKTLENDYKTLLGVKLECIAEGETTGKVNKEVKSFFTHLKTRLVTSERDWETERAMWQLRVFELESQK